MHLWVREFCWGFGFGGMGNGFGCGLGLLELTCLIVVIGSVSDGSLLIFETL